MQPGNFGGNRTASGAMQQQQANFGSFGGGMPQGAPQGYGMNPQQMYPPQQGGVQGIQWIPPSPIEKNYYDMLFQIADEERSGAIGGRSAVMFFTKSGLDKLILREVWTIADSRQASQLLPGDFYVAMRLIAMAQQGQPVALQRFYELAAAPFALAQLEGVPPPPSAMPPQATYAITSDEKTKYQGIFAQYDTDHDGFLNGPDAAALFQMSGMDRNDLRTVWTLADRTSDGRLDMTEFYVAMHLIVCVTKRNLPLPSSIPPDMEQSLRPTGSFTQPPASAFGGFASPPQPQQAPATEGMSAFDALGSLDDAPPPPPLGQPTLTTPGFDAAPHEDPRTGFGGNAMSAPSAASTQQPSSGSFHSSAPAAGFGDQQRGSFIQAPPTSGFGNDPRTSSLHAGQQRPMGSFGQAASAPTSSGFGSQQVALPPSGFGDFGHAPPASPAVSTSSASGFGSNRAPSVTGGFTTDQQQHGMGSFGQSPAASITSSPQLNSSFGSNHAPNVSAGFGDFGLAPPHSASVPSPSTSGFGSNRAPTVPGGFADHRGVASFGQSPAASITASPLHRASAPSGFLDPAASTTSVNSGFGSCKTPSVTGGFGDQGGFGDFGRAAPATSFGFGDSKPPSETGGFGDFGLAPPVSSSISAPSTSGFGSSHHSSSTTGTFGDFGQPPAAATTSSPAPNSGFGSVKAAQSGLGGVSAPPSGGFGDFGHTPAVDFGSAHATTSGFGDFPSPTNSSAFGDFSGADAAKPASGFDALDRITPPSTDSGFGSNKQTTVASGFDDFPSPTGSTGFGDFSGAAPSSTMSSGLGDFGSPLAAPSGFGSNGRDAEAGRLQSSSPAPISASGFGSKSTDVGGFDAFPAPPSTSSASEAPFAPPTSGSDFGDFASSSVTSAPADAAFGSSHGAPSSSGFGDFGATSTSSGFGDFPSPVAANPSSAPATSGFGDFPSPISSSAPPASGFVDFPSPIANNSTSAAAVAGGFGDFPSPLASSGIPATSGFGDFPSPIASSAPLAASGFGDFAAPVTTNVPKADSGFGVFASPPTSSFHAAASTSDAAVARDLDAANEQLLRSLAQLTVQQKHIVQVTHIESFVVQLLSLTAQRDQLRLNKPSDPTLVLSLQRLIDDERAFIANTTSVIQELESSKPKQPVSRQSSSTTTAAATTATGLGNFGF
ncbi:Aste57867_21084 [Aphanomyces stellatus]|uniref:Aste57867_21084 protein n=1 Tax=Aphanomyces stellatus TaxID=120398 RepID=A0A485LGQ3_9STRA|nr:hypothetical protein As57867_021016 [Aphanomyces stellatus]VFT97758.1 Aste57867_21084 [Aphanomyces stellatus]